MSASAVGMCRLPPDTPRSWFSRTTVHLVRSSDPSNASDLPPRQLVVGLSTTTGTCSVRAAPFASVTVTMTSYVPGTWYVYDASAMVGCGAPATPKSHLYVSGLSPSGSVATAWKATVIGAVPRVGVALTWTSGRWLSVTPLPTKSTQLTFTRPPLLSLPAGWRTTKNNGPLVPGGPLNASVTSVYPCQSPVPGAATEPTSGPSVAPEWTSIVPPVPAEATRNRIESMFDRFAGSNDHQSPSSIDPMSLKPPWTSPVASTWAPGLPVPVP